MNEDVGAIFYLNELLNRAGMDTISAGHAVAFPMECHEQGVITGKDTDGLELNWGNSEAIFALVEKMIRRDGFGHVLADGVKQAVARIGKNAEPYGMHAGGQEPAAHDSRNDPGFALHYCVEPTPGYPDVYQGAEKERYSVDRRAGPQRSTSALSGAADHVTSGMRGAGEQIITLIFLISQ